MNTHKTIFTFSFPVTLTRRPQICSPSFSCPALYFCWIRNFYGFPIWRKTEARDRRTDGKTEGMQRLMRPPP